MRGKGKQALAIVDGHPDSLSPTRTNLADVPSESNPDKAPPPKVEKGPPPAKQTPKGNAESMPTRLDVLAQTAAAMQPRTATGMAREADPISDRRKRSASAAVQGSSKRAKQVGWCYTQHCILNKNLSTTCAMTASTQNVTQLMNAQVLQLPTTSASSGDEPRNANNAPLRPKATKGGRPGKQAAPPVATKQPRSNHRASKAPATQSSRGHADKAGHPQTGSRVGVLTVSIDACTAVLTAIQAVRVTTTPRKEAVKPAQAVKPASPGSGRRLRRKEATAEPPAPPGLEDSSSSSEEEGEDGWKASEVAALRKWFHLLNPKLPDFWQQVANMVGRSKQECMDKVHGLSIRIGSACGCCLRPVHLSCQQQRVCCIPSLPAYPQHFEGMDQGALGTRTKPARPPRYLAALREDAPPPALAGRGVGPAALRRAARTAWWAQRAEQRGLTALADEEGEEGAADHDEFLADMAEQERTDRYIDNLRKRSKLLRSRGAWAAAKRGAVQPVSRVDRVPKGADPTAIARRLLAQTQQSDEDDDEEVVDEYMSASDDEFGMVV